MAKIIIGIHGLANKPPKTKLKKYWRLSIQEGLDNVRCQEKFSFEMVFWADLMYKNLLHEDATYCSDSLFNKQPYHPARRGRLKAYPDGWTDSIRSAGTEIVADSLDKAKGMLGLDALSDRVMERSLRDLDAYYDPLRKIRKVPNESKPLGIARAVLQGTLKKVLRLHGNDEIMLIAHSMGSIIAYDVLRDLGPMGQNGPPRFTVPHLVTIGSPLGLFLVKNKIMEERAYSKGRRKSSRVRTPTIVTKSWHNYADRKDPVAIDTHLANDFAANDGGVEVRDDLIVNSYEYEHAPREWKTNHHKSYGYLRAPELSRHIGQFLES